MLGVLSFEFRVLSFELGVAVVAASLLFNKDFARFGYSLTTNH